MRRLLERIQAKVEDFVEQRDDLVLVMSCSDNDAALLLKIVQDAEQANSTDVFLLFGDDFVALEPYVSVAIERLREQRALANAWLEEQGQDLLPDLPDTIDDSRLSPIQRLGQAMMYARNLVPTEGGHRLIWAMCPQAIQDRKAYMELLSTFAARRGLRPGMQRLRILFRDQPATQEFAPELAGAPRVRFEDLDLGPEATQQALQEEVEDEELPDEQRMAALLQNALLDSAHGRRQDALDQFEILLGYYQHVDNKPLQALVMAAIGDLFHREEDLDHATYWYECAVPVAIESESPVVFHSVVNNLGEIAFKREEYDRAEQFYDAADQLAGKMVYAEGMVRARAQRGLCQEYQNAYDRAVESWAAATNVSRTTGMTEHLKENLEHLCRGYQKLGMSEQLAEARAELSELGGQAAPS